MLNGAGTGCQKCATGYKINVTAGTCVKLQCDCDNGTPASGVDCPAEGTAKCNSCNTGYMLSGGVCIANTCTCASGTPASGASCAVNGTNTCAACNNGFTLSNSTCVANVCTCENGTPSTGTDCPGSVAHCASCDSGYSLSSSVCEENEYSAGFAIAPLSSTVWAATILASLAFVFFK